MDEGINSMVDTIHQLEAENEKLKFRLSNVMLSLPSDDEIKKMLERPYKAYDDDGELVYDIMQYDLNKYEGAKKIRDYIAEKLGNGA